MKNLLSLAVNSTLGLQFTSLSEGTLDKVICKIWYAKAFWLGTGRFLKFSLYRPMCKTSDPRSGAKFDPRAIIWILLVEAH